MALSISTTLAQIRDLVDQVTGMERVYAPSETDANAIPPALNELPCAMVLPGPTTGSGYILVSGNHRHTYEVKIQVFEGGGDIGSRAASVLPFVDLILEKFVANVTLGNRVNSCVVKGHGGLVGLEYGGIVYTGYEITLEISEQASATVATGA